MFLPKTWLLSTGFAAALLLALPYTSQAQTKPELKLLADRAAWSQTVPNSAPTPASSWSGDALNLPALTDDNDLRLQAFRSIALGPAASWRVQVRLAAVAPAAADAALGVVLVAPNGSALAVMLRPRERDVSVHRHNGQKWNRSLVDEADAPMLAGDATAAHVLDITSEASRLRISIDGVTVATTPLLDFSPTKIGLRASFTQARFEQLVLQETGLDSRLARLAGLLKAPGELLCFEDALDTPGGAARGASALVSGIGGLFSSNADKARVMRPPIDVREAWMAPWSDADGAFQRDAARKRLVLQTKTKDAVNWVAPSIHLPMDYAGVAVQATISLPVLGDESNAGVMLRKWYPDSKTDPKAVTKPDEMLYAQLTKTELKLYERTGAKETWQLIDSVPHGGVTQQPITLRLVQQRTNAWVFIDGRLLLASDNIEHIRPNSGGLRAEGVATIEASHFLVSEI